MPKIQILQETSHATHLLKLLDKMHKYEMDPTKTVGATERTQDAGRTDGVKPVYSPNNFVVVFPDDAHRDMVMHMSVKLIVIASAYGLVHNLKKWMWPNAD